MSFLTCELRCHILDRQDQLNFAKDMLKTHYKTLDNLSLDVQNAQKAYEDQQQFIARRERFIALVESTLNERWIERPDLLEAEWMEEKS